MTTASLDQTHAHTRAPERWWNLNERKQTILILLPSLAALAIFGVGRWSLDGTLLKPWLRRWGLSTPNG